MKIYVLNDSAEQLPGELTHLASEWDNTIQKCARKATKTSLVSGCLHWNPELIQAVKK